MESIKITFKRIIKIFVLTIIGTIKAILPYSSNQRKSVRGEVVLITGAASGLGRLFAIEFGKLGAQLVLWDINTSGNEETRSILEDKGIQAICYTVDLAKSSEIECIAHQVLSKFHHIDIILNNAGIVNGHNLTDTNDQRIHLTIDINLKAPIFVTKAFLPKMIERNHGHVVTIASMAGKVGSPKLTDYCASKYGAVGFSSSLSSELRSLGLNNIHVTSICPFYVNTGMFNGVEKGLPSLFPVLEADYVVQRSMEAILTNQYELCLPRCGYLVTFLSSFLPNEVHHTIAELLGLNATMDHFIEQSDNE